MAPRKRLLSDRSKLAIDRHRGGVVTTGFSLVQRLRFHHDPMQAQP
jgi:hypothetical protein